MPSFPASAPARMGHVLLMVPHIDTALAFYRDLLGFRISDFIRTPITAYFLHVNPRHHSLAVVADRPHPLPGTTLRGHAGWRLMSSCIQLASAGVISRRKRGDCFGGTLDNVQIIPAPRRTPAMKINAAGSFQLSSVGSCWAKLAAIETPPQTCPPE
jgi:hypothetical protein